MADAQLAEESNPLYLAIIWAFMMKYGLGSSDRVFIIEGAEDFAGEAGAELTSILGRPKGRVFRIPGHPGWLEVSALVDNETMNTYFVLDDSRVIPAKVLDFLHGEVEEGTEI